MKLTNLSCTQFAGIRDRSIDLTDGVNVIFGRNESGKSTLVNLLSRTLFQDHRIDGRRDKDFQNLFYPAARKGSRTRSDFADGRLTLETSEGSYTLTKEWGSDSRCLLSTPDGVIRDQASVNRILKDILGYSEGVYYQWVTALDFAKIIRAVPIKDIVNLYSPYHEMDIRQFCDQMNELYRDANPETNLKFRRKNAGLSQRELAEQSGVPLRTIQQYEQRQKSINRAQAEYLVMLAKVLCCDVDDLLEKVE